MTGPNDVELPPKWSLPPTGNEPSGPSREQLLTESGGPR